MVRLADLEPPADGVKVTLIVQFAPGRSDWVHVVADLLKSPLFGPVKMMFEIFSASFPPLVSVTVCAALVVVTLSVVNVSEVGERVAVAPVPSPNKVALCEPPGASSVITNVAEFDPVALGVNVTVMVQVPPAGTLTPQVFCCVKLPTGLAFVMAMAGVPIRFSATA